MQKDLKIGMVLGLVMAAAAALWLSTRSSLSVKARIPLHSRSPAPESPAQPAFEPNSPNMPDQSEKIETPRFHIVRSGQTLSEISSIYYGSADKWRKILDANRRTIKDADKLRPGTKIIIPE